MEVGTCEEPGAPFFSNVPNSVLTSKMLSNKSTFTTYTQVGLER